MTKYLEQTELIWNSNRKGRSRGRWAEQCFVQGTRWVLDEEAGTMSGDGMTLHGSQAEEIRAVCKEVEPGFGVMVNEFNFSDVIGYLIDHGKITLADLQDALDDDYDDSDETDDANEMDDADDKQYWKTYRRHQLNSQGYDYRHWLSLKPPSTALIEEVAEDEKQDAIIREYEERTKR